jgi:hypothetical protein
VRLAAADALHLGDRYEELRAFALGQGGPGSMPQGLALVRRQGLPSWIAAWEHCRLGAARGGSPGTARPPTPLPLQPDAPAELARLLAGMALAAVGGDRL